MKNTELYKESVIKIRNALISDGSRRRLSFSLLNGALAFTAFGMSIVNIFTAEHLLFIFTFVFGLLCLINISLLHFSVVNEKTVYFVFGIESIAMLVFFFVSGIPNGFSALWVCLIPSFALLIFGIRVGSAFSAFALLMMIFFFWLPFGKSLLMYSYTDEFLLRFPFLYCSVFTISLLIEVIRMETQKQLEQMKEKYIHLYRHDALTGLYNRYGIKEYLDKAFSHDSGGEMHVSVIIFDIDDFKGINDIHGHECGDEVLKKISGILLETMCAHCHCCRWGGEEFLIVMQCEHDAAAVADDIRQKIEQTGIIYNGDTVPVTVSMGVCVANELSGVSVHSVIDKADRALYASKSKGKNCVTVYKI